MVIALHGLYCYMIKHGLATHGLVMHALLYCLLFYWLFVYLELDKNITKAVLFVFTHFLKQKSVLHMLCNIELCNM